MRDKADSVPVCVRVCLCVTSVVCNFISFRQSAVPPALRARGRGGGTEKTGEKKQTIEPAPITRCPRIHTVGSLINNRYLLCVTFTQMQTMVSILMYFY